MTKYNLGDIVKIKYGKDHKQLNDGNIPVYGTGGIMRYADTELYSKKSVLIPRKGSLGNLFLVTEPFWTVDTLFYTEINESIVIPEFLFYKLKTYDLASLNVGSAVPSLTTAILNALEVEIPSLEMQSKIIGVLQAFDFKIENNKKINHHLEQIGQELFEEIYYDGSSAQLGDIISTLESGSRPKGGAETDGIPSIGAENIERFGQYDYTKEKFISLEYFQKLKRGIVHSGDVLLYKDGAYTGKVSMALDDFPHAQCAINEHIFILRPNELAPSSFFLYFLLLHDKNKQALFSRASSKAAQPGLNQTEVKTLPILLPKTEMITKFESTIAPVMHQIAKNANENRKLITLQKALLPKLLSGEISVN